MLADPGQEKLEQIRALEAKSSDGVIIFDDKTYLKYVLENPRPYDIVTLFSVNKGCEECQSVYHEFTGL